MQLKEFIAEYEKAAGPNDFLSLFYEDLKGRREHISESQLKAYKPEAWTLLLEADIIRYGTEETEGTSVALWGGKDKAYKCLCWSAQIDADEAQIALGVHPLLRKRKAAENKPIQPKRETASTKRRKAKKAAKRGRIIL